MKRKNIKEQKSGTADAVKQRIMGSDDQPNHRSDSDHV